MVPLQQLEAQYRAIIAQMDQSEAAIASQDLDRLEVFVQEIDQALTRLAQISTHLAEQPLLPGEEKAWENLADAMRQALARVEQNREQIQRWIAQTQDILAQMSRGGRAVNGYSTTCMPDGAEFLNARG